MIHFDDVVDPRVLRALSLYAAECFGQALRVHQSKASRAHPVKQHERLFPPWAVLDHPARCSRVLAELPLLLGDGFVHRLSGLHACVLFEMVDECAFFADVDVKRAQAGEIGPEEGEAARGRLERVTRLRRHRFGPAGVGELEEEVAALLVGPPRSPERIARVLTDYAECIPADVKAEIEARHRP